MIVKETERAEEKKEKQKKEQKQNTKRRNERKALHSTAPKSPWKCLGDVTRCFLKILFQNREYRKASAPK